MNKEYLLELRSDPRFRILMDRIVNARPGVPKYTPGADVDQWKYESGKQAGFDLALAFFGEKELNDG